VRNYLGPIKTPYDKRDLASRLEAFIRREETRASIMSLVDELDARIIGSALLVGPCPEHGLRELFAGELPLFDLGLRIDNLLDRLILFRYQAGGKRLVAVNPILEEELGAIALEPELFLGRASAQDAARSASPVGAESIVALFSFAFHSPAVLRKSGGLTKKGLERASALFPSIAAEGLDFLVRAFEAALFIRAEGDCRLPDRESFARALEDWGEDLPFYLAGALASDAEAEAEDRIEAADASDQGSGARPRELGALFSTAMRALPAGFRPDPRTLPRWLRIASRVEGLDLDFDPQAAAAALAALGLCGPRAGGAKAAAGSGGRRGPVLIAEGSHALHLMPEASLEERFIALSAARPVSLEKVWSLEVDRETARQAFASGLSAPRLRSSLEAMSGSPLPQSLAFSLAAWEEEYRSLRLYRGFVLVADERQRPIVERAIELGRVAAEVLADGVYFLSAVSQEAASAVLAGAGLEAPPAIEASPLGGAGTAAAYGAAAANGEGTARGVAAESAGGAALSAGSRLDASIWVGRRVAAAAGAAGEAAAAAVPDPEPRLAELRAAVASSGRGEEELRELQERVDRRLVLTARQIAQADPRSERLEAGGLDYLGKVRVVERALRGRGDRLEVLYRLPGAEPVRAMLRPVRLERNDKGLVLEAEDLGTGGPARVPLGAVSTVRRVRASLFGEEQ